MELGLKILRTVSGSFLCSNLFIFGLRNKYRVACGTAVKIAAWDVRVTYRVLGSCSSSASDSGFLQGEPEWQGWSLKQFVHDSHEGNLDWHSGFWLQYGTGLAFEGISGSEPTNTGLSLSLSFSLPVIYNHYYFFKSSHCRFMMLLGLRMHKLPLYHLTVVT